MCSKRGFAAICLFPGNPPMFALEKRYNKTYGRRLGQDISDFLHMDRQIPDHERALFFGNTLFSIGRYLITRELFSSEILCFLTFPYQLSNRSQDTMASLGELFVRKLPKFANHCQRRGGLNDHCI